MRIGIVTTWFERGAAYVSRQYRDVLANEHDVFIFARGGEAYGIGNPDWDTPNVTWAKKQPSNIPTIFNLNQFKRWLNVNKIEIVFFNEQWWWPPITMARKLGIITGAYIDYYTEQTIPFFASFDFLICNTKKHFSAFSWHSGAVYIPWGTDIDLFRPLANPVNTNTITFFHSGGVSPQRKGCDYVIRAFNALKGNCRLVIHAQRSIRTSFPDLCEIIDSLEQSNRLEYYEKTVPAPGLFYLGDVYVYPTRLEGIGLTIMEAGASGLPVIVTDSGPMNEFIRHDDNGRLVAVERLVARPDGYYWPQAIVSLDSLIIQMQWYIDNINLLPELKFRARYIAEHEFNWNNVAKSVLDVFANAKKHQIIDEIRLEERLKQFSAFQQQQYKFGNFDYLKKWSEIEFPRFYKLLANTQKRILSILK